MNGSGRGVLFALVVALVALHFTLHLALGLGREAPDLLTLAVLLAARRVRMGTAAALGLAMGVLEDALSLLAFGANAVALAVVGAVGAATREFFVGDSILFVVAYLVLGKWLRDAVHWAVAGPMVRGDAVTTLLLEAPLSALYVGAVGLVIVFAAGSFGAYGSDRI